MKKLFSAMLLIAVATIAIAQVPQGIPYQAFARNSSGVLLASTNIAIRFSIRDSIPTGSIKYSETHSITTSAQGMFSVNVGQGTPVIGTFQDIYWATNSKYMQVEMSPSGGGSYIDMGTMQMMSVPYSLYSATSRTGYTHYVGELYGGGIVFHVYRDSLGEHGLIASVTDLGNDSVWSNVDGIIGVTAQSNWDGLSNSNAIIAQVGHINSIALSCRNYLAGGYSDWYLPSIDELDLLLKTTFNIEKNFPAYSLCDNCVYWSSTENIFPSGTAKTQLAGGSRGRSNKVLSPTDVGFIYTFRAVRRF